MNVDNSVLKCLKSKKSLGMFFGGLRDNDSKKPPARKFYPHRGMEMNKHKKFKHNFFEKYLYFRTIYYNITKLQFTCTRNSFTVHK